MKFDSRIVADGGQYEVNECNITAPVFEDFLEDRVMCPMKHGTDVDINHSCKRTCPCCVKVYPDGSDETFHMCGYAHAQLMSGNMSDIAKALANINNNLVASMEDIAEHLDIAFDIKHEGDWRNGSAGDS